MLDKFAAVFMDDIGYVQQDREEMEVRFTFLAEWYERRSVMITANLVFSTLPQGKLVFWHCGFVSRQTQLVA